MQTGSHVWWGRIPKEWDYTSIKHGFDIVGSGTTPPTNQRRFYNGDVAWVTTSELRENLVITTRQTVTREALDHFSSLKLYPPDSVLIAMYGATIGRVGMLGISASVNQAVCVLAKPTKFEPRFVFYGLEVSRDYLLSLSSGGGQPNLNAQKIAEYELPCPPIHDQRLIADYLEQETKKIDALIESMQRLLTVLAEKRQAVITHAVTRGLNPDAPMRDSGVAWIGEIPAHWKVVKLGYIADIFNGTTPSRIRAEYWNDGTIPWVSSGKVNDRVIDTPSELITELALKECSLSIAPKGSVVIGMIGQGRTRGMSARLAIDTCINQNLAAVVPNDQHISGEFLHIIFLAFYEQIRELGRGGNQDALNTQIISSMIISLPPLAEQEYIAGTIGTKLLKSTALANYVDEFRRLFEERRTSLISAAVTGQIQVTA